MKKSVNIFALVVLLNIFMGTVSCGQDSTGSQQGEVTIASVTPSEVAVGDTLTLRGTNFSASGSNRVIFIRQGSETIARPFAATSTRLQVVVPDAIGEVSVMVKVGDSGPATSPQGITIVADKGEQIVKEHIRDPHFERGFTLTPLRIRYLGGPHRNIVDTLGFGNGTSSPVWKLTQWWSDYSLEGARPTEADDGRIVYSNPGKKVALNPKDHSLLLEVDASREYDHPRKDEEHWVHFIISQGFKSDLVSIAKVDKIMLSLELKLVKAENKMAPEDYNPSIHTAHTPLFVRVRNKNVHSKDYNNFIYFGIRSYDYRNVSVSTTEGIIGRDRGGNKLIYQMPAVDVWGGNITFNDHQWHRGKIDIKPHIKKALQAAHESNAFTDTGMGDLKITSMSYGWEVPGTFDVAIKVKNMSLKTVTYKD